VLFESLVALGTLIMARLLWQRQPNLATCGLFWFAATVIVLIGWSWHVYEFVLAAGVASNAAVTLANGGFMPVAGHRRLMGPARSVWVQREDAKHLLFLGDNWGNRHIRFSVGDTLLAAGIVLSFFNV
jgi:hypothetical protein